MKILMINKYLYPRSGDSIATLQTGELFRRKGHEVHYWGMAHPDNPPYPYADLFVKHIDYNYRMNLFTRIKAGLKILYSWEARRKLSLLLGRWKPDVAHIHNIAHQLSPSILDTLKYHKIPVVMTMHDYKMVCPTYFLLSQGKLCDACSQGEFKQCYLRRCVRDSKSMSLLSTLEMYLHHKVWKIYSKVDCYTSPSSFLLNKVQEMGLEGEIIHLPTFMELPLHPVARQKENTIFFAGRLVEEKGVDILLDAAKRINTTVKIAGDGPLKSRLLARIREEKIKNVIYLGQLSRDEVLEQIEKTRMVILPSCCYENYPMLILEAFSRSVPVLASHLGGMPELVKDDLTGYTFDYGKGEVLAEKINYLLLNPRLQITLGESALNLVKKNNNAQAFYKKLLAIYQRLQKKHSGGL